MSQKIPRKEPEPMTLLSGAGVPVSGVWRPNHDDCSSVAELWLPRQAIFPYCPCCGQAAEFSLVEAIGHISEDPDFQ